MNRMLNNINKLIEEAENTGKYFYIVGDAEKTDYYYDSDVNATFTEPKTVGKGYEDKTRYNTLQEVIDAVIEEGYGSIEDKDNFPKEFDYLEDITNEDESKLTPYSYPQFNELLSWFVQKEEDFGDEEHERYEIVTRLIQICKEK